MTTTTASVASRVDGLGWNAVATDLDEVGIALTGPLPDELEAIATA
jgi:hypothetical protein